MSEKQSSYRQIIKATSLFGGVQVFNILIAIIRSKFIAVLLGPVGMGIAGLLNATIGLITGFTNFGLGTSAVKNVASAYGTGNETRIAIIITVLRRWVWVTGLLGMIVTIVTAPMLSRLTFGNTDYTYAFIWISVSLLLTQLSSGQIVILQGMRKLQHMAKASLTGSILGLFITLPLYYVLGIKGVVPGIIVTSLITFSCTWYYARKVSVEKVKVSKARTFAEGKEMLAMGFMISVSGLFVLGESYIVRVFISNTGGVEQVGLYAAGFSLINTYVGLIFSAMSTDYYPRLSAVANDNVKCSKVINEQAEIAILILAPVIAVFLVYINWVIIILYSTRFVPVNTMILYAGMGMFFKAVSWSIAFIFLAKGASKQFIINELIANLYLLGFNLLGYKLGGLTGLGISFMCGYALYMCQVFVIAKMKYQFSFNAAFYKIFVIQLLIAVACFLAMKLLSNPYNYVVGSVLIVMSVGYAYKGLDDRLGLKSIFSAIKNKF